MAWVAIIVACTGPLAVDCETLVSPTTFGTVEMCRDDVERMQLRLYEVDILSTGSCVEVLVGDPV